MGTVRKVQVGSRGGLSLKWWWRDGEGRHFSVRSEDRCRGKWSGISGGGEKQAHQPSKEKQGKKWVIWAGAGFKESWVDVGQTNPGLNVRTGMWT